MIINIRDFLTGMNKKKLSRRLDFLKAEGQMVRRTLDEQAATKSIGGEAKEILSNEELTALLQEISPSGFVYRVEIEGALEAYRNIGLSNYRELVDAIGHMDRDSQFLKALCLIDKCEEFGDYEYMVRAFKITEYVVRHNKTNTPVVSYARPWIIAMRRYLEENSLM